MGAFALNGIPMGGQRVDTTPPSLPSLHLGGTPFRGGWQAPTLLVERLALEGLEPESDQEDCHPFTSECFARSLYRALSRLQRGSATAFIAEAKGTRLAFVAALLNHPAPPIFDEELRRVRHAAPKRRREFAWGRWCARTAMAQLDLPQSPILIGPCREPIWPHNLSGSISHSEDVACAVVVEGTASIAIDVERPDRLIGPAVARIILRPEERDALSDAVHPSIKAVAIFSIKEAVFKLLFAEAGRHFDFQAVRVDLSEPAKGTRIVVTEQICPTLLPGFVLRANYIRTTDVLVAWAGRAVTG